MSDPDSGVGRVRTRRIVGHSATSGEEFVLLVDEEVGRRPPKIADPYVMVFMDGIDRALAGNLTTTEWRVFMLLLRRSRSEPWRHEPGKMAHTLGIDIRRVSRALTRLHALGLIRRPSHGLVALEPVVAWRGTGTRRAQALLEEVEA